MSTTAIKPCPKCRSNDVVHKDGLMHDQNHAALHAGGHALHGAMKGHPAGLLAIGGLWAVNKVIHMVSKPWRCSNCGHEFA